MTSQLSHNIITVVTWHYHSYHMTSQLSHDIITVVTWHYSCHMTSQLSHDIMSQLHAVAHLDSSRSHMVCHMIVTWHVTWAWYHRTQWLLSSRMTSSFSTMFSQWMSSGSKFVMEGVKNLVLGTKVRQRATKSLNLIPRTVWETKGAWECGY